jgi:hypothetical protein
MVRTSSGFEVYPDWRSWIFPVACGTSAYVLSLYSFAAQYEKMPLWFSVGAASAMAMQIPVVGWMLFFHLTATDYRKPLLVCDFVERLVRLIGTDAECKADDLSKIIVERSNAKIRGSRDDRIVSKLRAIFTDVEKDDLILLQSDNHEVVLSAGKQIAESFAIGFESRNE